MLEINSVQQMAQYLEDYLNLIKKYPHIQIEHELDSLFLQAFDTIKNLLEQLEASLPIESVVNKTMFEVEPVFALLNQHLKVLLNQTGCGVLLKKFLLSKLFVLHSQPNITTILNSFINSFWETVKPK